jgi:archaeosortase C (PEF-CTERM variant)
MKEMKTFLISQDVWTKVLYAFSASIFIIGLRLALSWSYNSRFAGVFMVLIAILITYFNYMKGKKDIAIPQIINSKRVSLGALLILIDIFYNLYASDPFRHFDFGMLLCGLTIILLNLGLFRFLKLDEEMIVFTTYFLFTTMLLYGFLFSGLPFLLKSPTNPLFDWFTKTVTGVSAIFLNMIRPTSITGNIINFNGFSVGIGYACSGIESISVFFSALVAYFVAARKYTIKKMGKFMLMGGMALYLMNIVRVMIIVMVGYCYGIDTMSFVHQNLGWVIFVCSMAVFWYLLFR